MKKIILFFFILISVVQLSSCRKADPDFFKSMFKGANNKQTNLDITMQAANVQAELFKYKVALDECIKQGKIIQEDSINIERPATLPANACFVPFNHNMPYITENVLLELDDKQVPTITAIIGGTASDKIYGQSMSMTRIKKNLWQCRTTIALAYIPVGCEHKY